MKVLLIKDVYKLGRAGDLKKVADGYGRNYLLTQGMAVLATPGALKQADHIRQKAAVERAELNNELSGLSEQIQGLVFGFSSKAGETGKLYGSITTQMIADAINTKLGITKINRHHIEVEPIRMLGEYNAMVQLTMDLNPEVKIIVHREGELPASLHAPVQSDLEVSAEHEIEVEAATEEVVEEVVEAIEETIDDSTEVENIVDSDVQE